MGYSKVNLNEIEPTGPGGMVRFVRREIDLQAFGPIGSSCRRTSTGVHHDERESGQEEVNVIRGSATYVIDGEEVPIREGDVFRFDPETERGPKAGPDGLEMVAVGARRGSYEPRGPY